MTSWMHIDTGIVPGGTPLHLMRRGHEFSIVADTIELMNSTRGASEEALAILACGRVRGRGAARVLVGGLGMGFTLRAALRNLGPEASVTVAELVPTVAAWARGPLAGVFAGCLDDARVDLREADVDDLIQSGPAAWDAILLDVDNGPEGFVRPENDRLYGGPGLALARRALRPGGACLTELRLDTIENARASVVQQEQQASLRLRSSAAERRGFHLDWIGRTGIERASCTHR